MLKKIEIKKIKIGKRTRRQFGDLKSLAKSIEQIGLLQPIGITSSYELIYGERILRALKIGAVLGNLYPRLFEWA